MLDVMLKYTNIELELLYCVDKYKRIDQGISGNICQGRKIVVVVVVIVLIIFSPHVWSTQGRDRTVAFLLEAFVEAA